jgi:hypothetical protein
VIIPGSVKIIGDYAFYACENLTTVIFESEGLEHVGMAAFAWCPKLTYIELPDSVTSVEQGALCTTGDFRLKYKDIIYNAQPSENYAYNDGRMLTYMPRAFYDAANWTLISQYSTYGDFNFWDCAITGGVEITRYIGSDKHAEVPAYINNRPVTSIGVRAFEFSMLTSVILPDTVQIIRDYAFRWMPISDMIIPDSVTHIGEGAFFNSHVARVTLGNNVVSIGNMAFVACSFLESINIPDSLVHIGEYVFSKSTREDLQFTDGFLSITYNGITYVYEENDWDEYVMPQSFYDAVNNR